MLKIIKLPLKYFSQWRIFFVITLLVITPLASTQANQVGWFKDKLDEAKDSLSSIDIKELTEKIKFTSGDDDEKTLETYSRTYTLEGAAAGILVGVGANCVKNVLGKGKCLDNAGVAAAVGGTLGAFGGWFAASQQRKLQNESVTLEEQINSARLELEQAKLNREAAERLVVKYSTEIEKYRSEIDEQGEAQKQLEEQIEKAEETKNMMLSSIKRMDAEITALEDAIKAEINKQAESEFSEVLSGLKKEKRLMEGQIKVLEDSIVV